MIDFRQLGVLSSRTHALPGCLTSAILWFPTRILLDFSLWVGEWCQQNATLLEAGPLLDRCRSLAWKLLESRKSWWTLLQNLAGTWLEERTLLEPTCWSRLEPSYWNPWLEHLAGSQCRSESRFFLEYCFLPCFASCAGLWCWKSKSGLNFAGAVLQPGWDLKATSGFSLGFVLLLSFFKVVAGNERSLAETVMPGSLPEPLKEPFAGTLAWTLQKPFAARMPCRNSFAGTSPEAITKLADVAWIVFY